MKTDWLERYYKTLLDLDLQYFADGEGHRFAADPTPAEPHPFAAEESSTFSRFAEQPNPLISEVQTVETPILQGGEQQPILGDGQEQPPSQQPQEEVLKFGDHEIKAYGDDVRELHRDYTQLSQTVQNQSQELEQARQLLAQYQTVMQQQQPLQQPEVQQQTAIDPVRMQELHEEYQERMYENKFEADKWWNEQPEVQEMERQRIEALVQQRVNEVVGPIQQEREINQQVSEAKERYEDFDNYTDTMQALLQESPQLAELPNAIDNLYFMAKGRVAQTAPQPEQLLSDPSFQQQIIQNEQIRNMILQSYQQAKVDSQPPIVMAQQVSQTPTSLGEKRPKTLAEASAAFMKYLGNK
ncbi:hypothetical protein [Lysinibacillus sp. BNK-21]|uniref:hypothetical protein n=1 Tax=Lysinibacillus sp. BNK-21 TaxID=3376156 RepID=UPI003B4397B2